MISYSFNITEGKEPQIYEGRIKSPIKIAKGSPNKTKLRFDSDMGNRDVSSTPNKNTDFSIVYNK